MTTDQLRAAAERAAKALQSMYSRPGYAGASYSVDDVTSVILSELEPTQPAEPAAEKSLAVTVLERLGFKADQREFVFVIEGVERFANAVRDEVLKQFQHERNVTTQRIAELATAFEKLRLCAECDRLGGEKCFGYVCDECHSEAVVEIERLKAELAKLQRGFGAATNPVANPAVVEQVLSKPALKNYAQWSDHFKTRVLDPDGWRKQGRNFADMISEDEFAVRWCESTCDQRTTPEFEVVLARIGMGKRPPLAEPVARPTTEQQTDSQESRSIKSGEREPQCVDLAERPIVLTEDQSRDMRRMMATATPYQPPDFRNGILPENMPTESPPICRDCDGNELKGGDTVECVDDNDSSLASFGATFPFKSGDSMTVQEVFNSKEIRVTTPGNYWHANRFRRVDSAKEQPAVTTKWEGAGELAKSTEQQRCHACDGDGLQTGPPECRPCKRCGGSGIITPDERAGAC